MEKKTNWTPQFSQIKKKDLHFKAKDSSTEFSISVGQAVNLASANHLPSDQDFLKLVLEYFEKILEAKLDDRFITAFAKFYETKQKRLK